MAEIQSIGATLNLCVLACSKGAEVYTIAWVIRSARPDLHLKITAVDISQEIVRFAEAGVYSLRSSKLVDLPLTASDDSDCNTELDQDTSIFELMTLEEIHSIFEIENHHARVRPWIKEGITWHCADACTPLLSQLTGLQDIVVANCFLCHMQPNAADSCLRNLAAVVRPGGHLFVAGIDLDVRSKVASECGWIPLTENLRDIHEGRHLIRQGWPLEYWGLEPFDDLRPDWQMRYASVFRIVAKEEESPVQSSLKHSAS